MENKKKRGRPRKNPIAIKKKKRGRPKNNTLVIKDNRFYVKVKCRKCHKKSEIRVNECHLHLYTEDYKKKYICLLCR